MLSAQANGGHCQDTDDARCIVCGVDTNILLPESGVCKIEHPPTSSWWHHAI
jgi:hypothetical protein